MESQGFHSVLASAILSDSIFTFDLVFVTDLPCTVFRVSPSRLSSLQREGGK